MTGVQTCALPISLAALPGCTSVIAGATSAEQVRANAAASDWIPEADDLTEISKIVPRS